MNVMLRAGTLAYRAGLGPRPSETPDARLVELVEGPARLAPGRALDLGCASGRNALYLARHGWEVTGVELVEPALATGRRRAASAGLTPQLVRGDVTRLEELGIGDGYTLLMDGGCYHMIVDARRDAYAAGVTRAAAPGARLIVVGFAHHRGPGGGVTAAELRDRLAGWDLVDAARVPGGEMSGYVDGPAPLRLALSRGWMTAWRFELARRA